MHMTDIFTEGSCSVAVPVRPSLSKRFLHIFLIFKTFAFLQKKEQQKNKKPHQQPDNPPIKKSSSILWQNKTYNQQKKGNESK